MERKTIVHDSSFIHASSIYPFIQPSFIHFFPQNSPVACGWIFLVMDIHGYPCEIHPSCTATCFTTGSMRPGSMVPTNWKKKHRPVIFSEFEMSRNVNHSLTFIVLL